MAYEFRKAVLENVGLVIMIPGPSGGGKTYTAMELATGIVGPGEEFAVIDTEARRALHYARTFNFQHLDLKPPFRPDTYAEAIKAADKAGFKAIVIDSGSHEWAGDGGVLDWHDDELALMVKRAKDRGDTRAEWQIEETMKIAAWIKPKMQHKAFVSGLLQTRAHLIICLRAEEKMKMIKDPKSGKAVPTPQGFQPIAAADFIFEATLSFMLMPDAPGVPVPIKLQEQHKFAFPNGKPVTREAGRLLAAWARGDDVDPKSKATAAAAKPAAAPAAAPSAPPPADPKEPGAGQITTETSGVNYIIHKGSIDSPYDTIEDWQKAFLAGIQKCTERQADSLLNMNIEKLAIYENDWPEEVAAVREAFTAKIGRGE